MESIVVKGKRIWVRRDDPKLHSSGWERIGSFDVRFSGRYSPSDMVRVPLWIRELVSHAAWDLQEVAQCDVWYLINGKEYIYRIIPSSLEYRNIEYHISRRRRCL